MRVSVVVPVLCVLVLVLAGVLLRRQRPEPEREPEPPVLAVRCEDSLRLPMTAVAEAFQRRHGVRVVVRFVPGDRLLAGDDEPPPAAAVVVSAAGIVELLEEQEAAQAFLRFLQGPRARGEFARYGVPVNE